MPPQPCPALTPQAMLTPWCIFHSLLSSFPSFPPPLLCAFISWSTDSSWAELKPSLNLSQAPQKLCFIHIQGLKALAGEHFYMVFILILTQPLLNLFKLASQQLN